MESVYKKMVLIPEEEYAQLKTTPLDNHTSKIERQMREMKERERLPDDQWLMVQSNLLSRARDMNTQPHLNDNKIVSTLHPKWVDQSIHRLPQGNRQRAKQMLEFLKTRNINWTMEGELMNLNGVAIPNSNIIDLINYVTISVANSRLHEPSGLNEFIDLLIHINLPQSMLGISGQKAYQEQNQQLNVDINIPIHSAKRRRKKHQSDEWTTFS